MSNWASFDPYDPEAVRFIQWLIQVANPQVTEFDATIERGVQEIGSAFSPFNEFRPYGPREITVHLTLRGFLPEGAEYQYGPGVDSVQEALPPSRKALP